MTVTLLKAGQTIWVTSHHAYESSGGFWWRPDRDTALMDYAEECALWRDAGIPTRIRLVAVELPPEALECEVTIYTGDGPRRGSCGCDDPVTCWLEANLDGLESEWRAERVRLILPEAVAR